MAVARPPTVHVPMLALHGFLITDPTKPPTVDEHGTGEAWLAGGLIFGEFLGKKATV